MNKLTKKQFLKRKTLLVAHELHKRILPEDAAADLTVEDTARSFPKETYFRHNETGEIRIGMSLKGIRKFIKRYPLVTVDQLAEIYGVG